MNTERLRKMKGAQLIFVVAVMALMSAALLMTNSGFKLLVWRKSPAERSLPTPAESEQYPGWTTTPGPHGANLKGKMFTLSSAGEGIRFYSPYYSDAVTKPWPSETPYVTTRGPTESYSTASQSYTRPPTPRPPTTKPPTTRPWTPRYWTTRPWTPRTRTPHYWTTAPPFGGVSVCLRYLAAPQRDSTPLFTLSPSTNPLKLSTNSLGTYMLPLRTYPYIMYMTPSIPLWKNIDSEMWTKVCLTVDDSRNVIQLFSGSKMSIRKILPGRYVWSGEPVIEVSGFDGQVTDIQVWNYPLRYKEVFNYMTNGVYASYRGSVLTWSHISYSLRGNALLEDVYEKQASQPISSQERKTKRVFKEGENRERNKLWFK
ncbi:uncharacterized protein LOC141798716 isoform X2 [Halichoeres trimaculatus]